MIHDGTLLVTAFWGLIIAVLVTYILILSKQLANAASTTSEETWSLEFMSILFGTSLVDVTSISLIGFALVSSWYLPVDEDLPVYCAHLLWRGVPVNVAVLFIIVLVVWMRYGFLLKDVTLPIKQKALEGSQSGSASYIRTIVDGPSWWFIGAVLAGLLLGVLVNETTTTSGNDLYQETFSICIAESTPPSHLLIILVVLLHVIWWSLAVLTTNMLKRGRHQNMHDAFFSVSRLMEIRQSEPFSEERRELTESQQESPCQLFVLLAMASIWLPPLQCLLAMAIFDFSAMTKTTILFLTLVYSCAAVLLSDIFGFCLAEGVHERRRRVTEMCTSSKNIGLSDSGIAAMVDR
ncbi:hypothetical protein LSH36_2130g00002 [Paralvinella palmiformis]|uniref:Uncharacterized protein n=1 Tax=Paralvinella palmiformis TaxID=53620 RepID=A0AAD9IQV1_9ANNE|nr:hypothetical protein LSH36_2130g00002 [Paralvinella palmiformis]